MKKWDGIYNDFRYNGGDLFIDDGGNIYFERGGSFYIWCAAVRLNYHLQHLYQITRRSLYDEKNNVHIVDRI